jgi:hypothetical protein
MEGTLLPKGGDMDTFCLLAQLKEGKKTKIKKGDELKIVTKTGRIFKGILYDIKEGYLHTVEALGILVIFPISSLSSIQLT